MNWRDVFLSPGFVAGVVASMLATYGVVLLNRTTGGLTSRLRRLREQREEQERRAARQRAERMLESDVARVSIIIEANVAELALWHTWTPWVNASITFFIVAAFSTGRMSYLALALLTIVVNLIVDRRRFQRQLRRIDAAVDIFAERNKAPSEDPPEHDENASPS